MDYIYIYIYIVYAYLTTFCVDCYILHSYDIQASPLLPHDQHLLCGTVLSVTGFQKSRHEGSYLFLVASPTSEIVTGCGCGTTRQ
jgi:hypothetical protein